MNEEREVFADILIGLVVMVAMLAVCVAVLTIKYTDLKNKYDNLAIRCKRIETSLETTEDPVDNGLVLEEGGK
jgi:hypothetical protein